jgi:diguanylate cyclase (GGDEF)-like protein
MLCSLVLQRFVVIFGKKEVTEVIENLNVDINSETFEITDYNYTGAALWNTIFEETILVKGINWLIIVEPFIQKLSREYELSMPAVFLTSMKESYEVNERNQELIETNLQLENDIKVTNNRLIRCPVTGLYNFEFFREYLTTKITSTDKENKSALIIINIDNIDKISFTYGNSEVDEILKSTVYLIEEAKKGDRSMLFKLQGASFAWYYPEGINDTVLKQAEKLRNLVAASKSYIQDVTVSIGVVFHNEIEFIKRHNEHPFEVVYQIARLRAKLASTKGKNLVCFDSGIDYYKESSGKIMIVDTDEVNLDVLRTILESLKYEVLTAKDGDAALSMADREQPDAIISEIMLPKKDAFMVRESLLMDSQTKNILFILVSHLKNEDSVKRALSLKIEHYFKKPFMLSELLGIIKLKVKKEGLK